MKFLTKYTTEIIIAIVALYLFIPFLAPVAFKLGYEEIGNGINKVYEPFCHQRVERSIFLFGQKYRYNILELKEDRYLPIDSINRGWPEYFGHDYVGNSELGYKVPICIRDVALYGGFVFFSIILLLISKRKKIGLNKIAIVGLSLPMIIDGLILTVIDAFDIKSVPLTFMDEWLFRILTGILFGFAMALLIIPILKEDSLTKKQ